MPQIEIRNCRKVTVRQRKELMKGYKHQRKRLNSRRMAQQNERRLNILCVKIPYQDKASAASDGRRFGMRHYPCPKCRAWHLTSNI